MSDVVWLGQWPVWSVPLGCLCIRTVEGHMFPPNHVYSVLENVQLGFDVFTAQGEKSESQRVPRVACLPRDNVNI